MRLQVKKWGNSSAVRIPASIIAAGRILIEPIVDPAYSLGTLLGQMDPKTFPEEADFGPAIGQEIW
jgi:antitoxin MazE